MTAFSKLHRRLTPDMTMGEIIFGLVMALTFTLGARIVTEEPLNGRELLLAVLGCNLAWGIIDGFLHLLSIVYERRRMNTLVATLRVASETAGIKTLRDEMENPLAEFAQAAHRDAFHKSILSSLPYQMPEAVRLKSQDVWEALHICFLCFITAIPAAIPFLFIDSDYVALRVSNAFLVGLLFFVGLRWGRHVGSPKPWLVGTVIMSIGVVLVLIAIPLGG
jgi:VIT1/CCC1 family predicted Fe2+/Mn2+ transporter